MNLRIRGPVSNDPGQGRTLRIVTTISTVGHSTHPIDEFVGILNAHGIRTLVDVRTVPRSRTNPQFNYDSLPKPLAKAGIGYCHIAQLGGLRARQKAMPESPNWA